MRRDFHVLSVGSVTAIAVSHSAIKTHLRPTCVAMPAGATAIVMMVHHPISNFRFFSKNCAAYFYNNAAWLVAALAAHVPNREELVRAGAAPPLMAVLGAIAEPAVQRDVALAV